MRIALIGANGQLGTDLRPCLSGEVTGLDRPTLDVRREDNVAAILAEVHPDVVINCAGLTHVDACEDQVEAALAVNAGGALAVARQAERQGAAVVYISTDYVYGSEGQRAAPYAEHDPPGPVNVYGVSKLAGEYLSRAYNRRCFIVRTCGLYGHAGQLGTGANFVESMLRLARAGQPVRVVDDQRVTPTSTSELAGKLAQLVRTDAFGLYHIAAPDSCTWFEFAQEIFRYAKLSVDLRPINSTELGRRAPRPAMSALRSVNLEAAGLTPCPAWRDMLHAYLDACPQRRS